MKTITHTLYNFEKQIVIGLMVLLGILFCLYGYFVNATIVNIVSRENFEQEAADLIAHVGMLEKEYGTLRSHITYNEAHTLGFKEPHQQVFASQKQIVSNLPLE